MNQYVAHRRFKENAICGKVDIKAGEKLTEIGGMLFLGKDPVCCASSENAHQYFAKNNDGYGLLRGQLTQAIQNALARPDRATPEETRLYIQKWDKVWADKLCAKFKRTDFDDYWLWNHDFFEAPIFHLQYIADLVEAKLKK